MWQHASRVQTRPAVVVQTWQSLHRGDVTSVSHRQTATQMASNVTIPDITSWWFRRVLGPDLIKCSSISADDVNDIKKELCVTTIESAILSSPTEAKESENISIKNNNSACQVIGLYFTPVNSCVDEGNVEEFTTKLVELYDRVNCCESKCSDSECCNTKTEQVNSATEDNCSLRSLSCKQRIKTRKLEVIHVVLPPGGNATGVGANVVLDPGSDCSSVLDEADFRRVVKDLPWFAIPYRDIHRTVRI